MKTERQLPEIGGYDVEQEVDAGWASSVWEVRVSGSGEKRAVKLVDTRVLGNPGIANALTARSGNDCGAGAGQCHSCL
ncbi:MAG: hypothetical protein U5O39_20770 [Gammaproteobacteria bacterium]|nr:hypothetical protein [Gammaproteobacteria bacterium]